MELQGHCSDQLTLICRHSDVPIDPSWIHNGTVEGGQFLSSAFPGVMYTVQSNTEHRVTISRVGNVQALDGYIIQCAYSIQSNLIKSNAVKYSYLPPGQCRCCIQDIYVLFIEFYFIINQSINQYLSASMPHGTRAQAGPKQHYNTNKPYIHTKKTVVVIYVSYTSMLSIMCTAIICHHV